MYSLFNFVRNISDNVFFCHLLCSAMYKVKRAKASGFHLSSVMNLGLKTHLPFSR